jgi:hypothetical protein
MEKENLIHTRNGILLSLKKRYLVNNIDEPGGHYINEPDTERQMLHDLT